MPGRGIQGARSILNRDSSVTKQTVKKRTTKRVLLFARPYGGLLSLFLLIVILDAIVGVATPLIYRTIINQGILGHDPSLIVGLALLAATLYLFDAAFNFIQSYLSSKIGTDMIRTMRLQLFEHIQKMSIAFFTRTQTGSLVSRLNTDVGDAQSAFTDFLSNVVGNLITVLLVLAAMFSLSWKITLAALILFPLFIIPLRFLSKKVQEFTRERYDLFSAMNSMMIERFNVAGALLSKLFGQQARENEEFAIKTKRVADISVKTQLYSRLFFTPLLLVASLATALTYGWGGVQASLGVLDVGTVVALVSYLQRLYGPLTSLSNVQVDVMTALVSFDRVFEVLDLPPMIQEKKGAVAFPRTASDITFEHVSFRYPSASEVSLASLESIAVEDKSPQKEILKDISFEIPAGSLTALVGPSGAGKTTITQLIPRLYDVREGSVKIDGIDVRDATFSSLHDLVGMVTQDAHLFHDTIRNNLAYAKPDTTDEEIWQAIEAAQIKPLVESLPDKLETMVGERGYRFSGGEKQRLAIARLLLKSPSIVILDEATAHLDSASEAAIQKAFEVALAGRTSIVIAHRLSTIIKADQILVIEDGKVLERGKHEELLKKGGLYADLYHRQFAETKQT